MSLHRDALAAALAATLIGAGAAAARPVPPDASDVIDAYLQARGGKAALEGLAAIERSGSITAEIGQGRLQSGTYHTCIRYPDRIAIEIDAGPWQLAQALRKDGAVECERGFRNCRPASAETAKELADTARNANKDLLDNETAWRKATVSAANGDTAWRLTLLSPAVRWAEFDRATGHLRWMGRGDRARRFGQWRTIEGVAIPFRLEDYGVEGADRAWADTVQLSDVRITHVPSTWCTERFGTD